MSETKISFDNPGTVPPVFVAGTFTNWQPVELNEEALSKKFDLEPGQYQYKFRLGTGDWWVCDPTKPQGPDENGNLNNILNIEPVSEVGKEKSMSEELTPTTEKTEPSDTIVVPTTIKEDQSVPEAIEPSPVEESDSIQTQQPTTKDKPAEILQPAMNGSAHKTTQETPKLNGSATKAKTSLNNEQKPIHEPVKKVIKKVQQKLPKVEEDAASNSSRWMYVTAAIVIPAAIAWYYNNGRH